MNITEKQFREVTNLANKATGYAEKLYKELEETKAKVEEAKTETIKVIDLAEKATNYAEKIQAQNNELITANTQLKEMLIESMEGTKQMMNSCNKAGQVIDVLSKQLKETQKHNLRVAHINKYFETHTKPDWVPTLTETKNNHKPKNKTDPPDENPFYQTGVYS